MITSTHTVGLVSVRRVAEQRPDQWSPMIFDLGERDDELEDQAIRVYNSHHFYIGDDDDEPEFQEVEEIDISDDEPMVRRLGEENEDVMGKESCNPKQ